MTRPRLAGRTERAILRNMLEETLRVYEAEIGLAPAPSVRKPRPAKVRARKRSAGLRGFGLADVKTENAILRRLLATTAEAYEDRLNAFRTEKELVRQLLAATSDAVVTIDASGAVTTLNFAAESLTGWTVDEARGHAFAEVVRLTDDNGEAIELDLLPCLGDGRLIEIPRKRLMHRAGDSLAVDGRAAAIHGERRSVVGAVVILRRDLSPA